MSHETIGPPRPVEKSNNQTYVVEYSENVQFQMEVTLSSTIDIGQIKTFEDLEGVVRSAISYSKSEKIGEEKVFLKIREKDLIDYKTFKDTAVLFERLDGTYSVRLKSRSNRAEDRVVFSTASMSDAEFRYQDICTALAFSTRTTT